MNIVLGTAQFGLDYGIANRRGRPDLSTVRRIVKAAWDSGIREFDTAADYGVSEERLGTVFKSLGIAGKAGVTTKLAFLSGCYEAKTLAKAIDLSLARLDVHRLHAVLLHDERLIDHWDKGLGKVLAGCVRAGKVAKIGVSVYAPERALEALSLQDLTVVQLPTNILDRRFEQAGVFEKAKRRHIDVYIRSVFLQGLLLMDASRLGRPMAFARSTLESVEAFSREQGIGRRELALGYVQRAFRGCKLVVGVDSVRQLRENIAAARAEYPAGLVRSVRSQFGSTAARILNPSLWGIAR